MALDKEFISGCAVKRAARRIHDAGGCNRDGDGKGYDDAITLALGILHAEWCGMIYQL